MSPQPMRMTTSLLVLTLGSGCASRLTTIPTGEWSGVGTYVDHEAIGIADGQAAPVTRSNSHTYSTTLKISRESLFGHDALVFEIRSERGKLLNLGDLATHIKLALVELETLDHGSTLYAVAGWHYNPSSDDPWDEGTFRERCRIASGSCVREGDQLVLQIHYAVPDEGEAGSFTDTFVFAGDKVRKHGSILEWKKGAESDQPKLSQVYWVETLHRVR